MGDVVLKHAATRALALWLASGVLAAEAAAATGELAQKTGLAGCVSETGAGSCADGIALGGARSVTVSPDGRSAYVASDNAVAVFDRAVDGMLRQKPGLAGCVSDDGDGPCADGTALAGANSVTVSQDGRSVYVTSSGTEFGPIASGAVAVFDRAEDGALTQKPGTAACVSETGAGPCVDAAALHGAASVTVSPGGTSAYVASRYSDAVAVFDRAADGTLTQKPGTAGCIADQGGGPCVDGMALNGAGVVTISLDGRSVYVASVFTGGAVAVFDRAPDGTLTQKPGAAGCLSPVEAPCATGRGLNFVESVTVSGDGRSVYAASSAAGRQPPGAGTGSVAVFDRSADGTLTQKPGTAGCISDTGQGGCADGNALANPYSVTLSPDGASAYVLSGVGVVVFDRAASGRLRQKAGTAGCVSSTEAGSCVDATALSGAASVTVSPDAISLYVASLNIGAIAVFDRRRAGPRRPKSRRTGPQMSALSLAPNRFRAAAKGPSIVARGGSRVSYTLSEPAAVSFRVERALPGRRAGGRCVAPKRSSRRAQRCTRYRILRGSFTHAGATGANRLRFSGRLRGRRLPPGRYRLRTTATDRAGRTSGPQHGRFEIRP